MSVAAEILGLRLAGIADEAQARLVRGAVSTLVREGQDCSAALFLADGRMIAEATAIPLLLGCLAPALAETLKRFPTESFRPGERVLFNDPYAGGTHLPDMIAIEPAFLGAQVIGFVAAIMHHQDVGGATPGSLPTEAREIFQEGLRLPPAKFAAGSEAEAALLALILANSRAPEAVRRDLAAQLRAGEIAAARLSELAAEFGADGFRAEADSLIRYSNDLTRAALAELPRGRWRYEDRLDHDGVALDRPVPIVAEVALDGQRMVVDLAGSAPRSQGPINAVRSAVMAAACFGLRVATGAQIPTNAGCYAALELRLPEDSVVNPRFPAAVNARTGTVKAVANAVLGALAEAMPERFPAANAGASLVLALAHGSGRGRRVTAEVVAGGSGAAKDRPGIAGLSTDVGNARNLPAEILEMEAPLRVLRVARRRGSGGEGAQPGGDGVVREYLALDGPIAVTHRGDRHLSRARGLAGGGAGASARTTVLRADGRSEDIPSKAQFALGAGDRLAVETAGGGGHGKRKEP